MSKYTDLARMVNQYENLAASKEQFLQFQAHLNEDDYKFENGTIQLTINMDKDAIIATCSHAELEYIVQYLIDYRKTAMVRIDKDINALLNQVT